MPRRLALLVATYSYQDAGLRQLTAPGHDAEELAAVLRDSEIAGFDVTILLNEPNHVVGRAIGDFYRNRHRDDLTLLYFTGHGVKDDDGRLFLAMTDTQRDSLIFTGISAEQIDDAMESCSSRQKVLVLDCCYSGAFPAHRFSKADPDVHTLERFRGKGRVVLAASDATQYSFEGNEIIGKGSRSLFTRFLVEGLTTGKGDLDGDGDISLDELYSYVRDRVIEEMPQQRPKKQENVEGRIVIARNIHWSLPPYLRNAIDSPIARDRLAALEGLAHLYRIGNYHVRVTAISEVRSLIEDDSKAVSVAAAELIKTLNSAESRRSTEGRDATVRETPLTSTSPSADMIVVNRWLTSASTNAQIQNPKESQNAPDSLRLSQSQLQPGSRYSRLPSRAYQLIVQFGASIIKVRRASEKPSPAHPSASSQSWQWGRRHRAALVAGSAALVIALTIVTVVILGQRPVVSPPLAERSVASSQPPPSSSVVPSVSPRRKCPAYLLAVGHPRWQ